MTDDAYRVRFWGVRGSVAVSGPQFIRYGGNTACVELCCGPHTLIFDAGSGLRPAGLALAANKTTDFDLFFSHCHYDHILGLPFFAPLYAPDVHINVWSGHLAGIMTTRQMLKAFMRPPWFPVEIEICRANITCLDFQARDVLTPRDGVTVRTNSLNHPGSSIGYRIEWGGRAVAFITDTEHVEGVLDENVLELIKDADLVIYDCTYTDAEMERFRGYGHSTWQQGIRLCEAAGARRLALFHHDPTRTDAQLAAIERQAKRRFKGAFAARDGMVVEIGE
jgi:phosphoribosyl 1,2-cyclic phosphodiesterase